MFELIARLSPYIMYGINFLYNPNLVYKMVGNDVFNCILKYMFSFFCPHIICFKRPQNTAWIDTPGFPSGHAQQFFYLFLEYYNRNGQNIYSTILFFTFIIISFSRLQIECHNTIQILGGILFGILYFIFIDF